MSENKENIFDKNTLKLTLITVLLSLTAVTILTRPALFSVFDLSQTGQIGDTIGGITAPLINIIAAILVYKSFKAQINANKIQNEIHKASLEKQTKDNNYRIALDLYQSIKNGYNSLVFQEGKLVSNRSWALHRFCIHFEKYLSNDRIQNKDESKFFIKLSRDPVYTELTVILREIEVLLILTVDSDMFEEERLQILRLVLGFHDDIVLEFAVKICGWCEKFKVNDEFVLLYSRVSDLFDDVLEMVKTSTANYGNNR